jgi:hypothetical protein
MAFIDSEVMDVQLRPSLLEPGQNVGGNSADDLATREGSDGNEGTAGGKRSR